jgi:hypothetical protein
VYQGDAGDYGGMPATYYGGPPIGERSRGALQADMANAAGFLMSPFAAMANYVLTGQTPAMQFGIGDQREALGLQQSDVMPQGILPQRGMSGMFSGLRDFLFGPQQQSVALGDMRAPAGAPNPEMNVAVFNDAYQLAMSSGADDLAATNAASTAASLVAQGVDPITAVTISAQYAVGAAGPQLPDMPGLSRNAFDVPSGPQTMAQSMPGLAAMNQTLAQFAQGGPAAVNESGSYGGQSFADSSNAPAGSSSFDDASSGAYGYF